MASPRDGPLWHLRVYWVMSSSTDVMQLDSRKDIEESLKISVRQICFSEDRNSAQRAYF